MTAPQSLPRSRIGLCHSLLRICLPSLPPMRPLYPFVCCPQASAVQVGAHALAPGAKYTGVLNALMCARALWGHLTTCSRAL